MVACQSTKKPEETKLPEYQVELNISRVIYYGDTINFEVPLTVRPIPNSDKIALIPLGNGNRFGVKYFVSTMITGNERKLTHNAVFYEEIGAKWDHFNGPDHREPLTLGQEKDWGISVGNGQETYFKVDFSYYVKEI